MSEARRTTKQFLIGQHYASLAEELTWSTNRLHRLCAALHLSPAELAEFIRCRPCHMDKWISKNSFPPTVELHLTLIERATMPDSKSPIFPSL